MNVIRNKLGKKSNKSYEDIHYSCNIRFLDDSEPITVSFQKDTKGQWLIDHVCKELNLAEKDYFGLRYVDSDKQRHWLDPTKPIHRQLKGVEPSVLCFRVKFYPADPMKLKEEITRYFLFLQLRRDLHHGRLICSTTEACMLAAYIIQSELGDFEPTDHVEGYVGDFKMLPKQTEKEETQIAELHQTLVGQVPAEAESNFLKKAATLDTYGVDPHSVKAYKGGPLKSISIEPPSRGIGEEDQKGKQMYLGVTHLGIVTFQGNKRTHLFKWNQINKLAFEGKMFIVHVTMNEGEEHTAGFKRKKHACGFKCPSLNACKHLWKTAIEQQYFFTVDSSAKVPKVTSGGGFFTRGCKYRFSGRVQKDVYNNSDTLDRQEPQFVRSTSNPQFVRSYNKMSKSATLPAKLPRSEAMNSFPRDARNTMSDVDLNSSSGYTTSQIDTSIPEQDEVVIAEHSYCPVESPIKEESSLPSHMVLTSTPADHLIGPPPRVDLDLPPPEIPTELKAENALPEVVSNHVLPAEAVILHKQPAPETNHKPRSKPSPPVAPKPVVPTMPTKAKRFPWLKAALVTLLMTLISLLIISYVVFETQLDAPGINDLRNLPEVVDFKRNHYLPARTSVVNTVNSWIEA